MTEWVQSGVIGDVYEVHSWTDRPIWPQGLAEPKGGVAIPDDLDWDLFIGPAKKRPYDPLIRLGTGGDSGILGQALWVIWPVILWILCIGRWI